MFVKTSLNMNFITNYCNNKLGTITVRYITSRYAVEKETSVLQKYCEKFRCL